MISSVFLQNLDFTQSISGLPGLSGQTMSGVIDSASGIAKMSGPVSDLVFYGYFLGMFISLVGVVYFRYGKKEELFMPMACGALMFFYPYFFQDFKSILLIGLGLAIMPFIIRL